MIGNQLTLDQESLRHRVSDVPSGIRSHVKMGFHLLGRLPQESVVDLRDYVIDSMSSSREIDAKHAEKLAGLNEHTISDVLTALTFTVASVVGLDVSLDDFKRFIPSEVIDADDVSVCDVILDGLRDKREGLRSALETSALARSALPSFQELTLEVDLRIRMDDENTVLQSVPVAVGYISTDCTEDVFFQASFDDIDRMVRKLEGIRQRMSEISKMRLTNG
jgi:hypothetical protein